MAPKKMTNAVLHKLVMELTSRIEVLEKRLPPLSYQSSSLEKVERHHNEESALTMGRSDVIISMVNAIAVLNPKVLDEKTGRHTIGNVAAIVGKKRNITEEMMDEAYKIFEQKG